MAHRALAAGDGEGDHHAVAHLQLLHPAAELDDLAHELVSQDFPLLHRGDEPVVKMQVGPANGGRRDLQDRVAVVQDAGGRHRLDADLLLTLPAVRIHFRSPRFDWRWWGRYTRPALRRRPKDAPGGRRGG